MTRAPKRLIGVAALLALLLIMATFPMRLALGLSGASDAGFSAQTVKGSVWSAEIVDARLGALPLGTLQARLSPLALLTGRTDLVFERDDARLGALTGRLHGSDPRGLSNVNGMTSLSGGLGNIPVEALRFEEARVRFGAAGRCVKAGGRLQLTVAAPIAGLNLSRGLSGPLSCSKGWAQAALASQSGMERLKISFDGSGAWRAEFSIIVENDPAMAAALAALGFRAREGSFRLTTSGRF